MLRNKKEGRFCGAMTDKRHQGQTVSGTVENNETVFSRHRSLFVILLLFFTLAVYWQVSGHEFVHFDDDVYITENALVRDGFSRDGLLWAFNIGGGEAFHWHPLTWLSHMMDCELFGLDSGMHHLMNVLFHVLNVFLLFLLVHKMTGAAGKSLFVAALFALHPINVDSVAWAAERKNLLSTSFWMLAMLAYGYYVLRPGVARYFPVIAMFILGLLAKPMLVTLPFVLLLMDYWPLKRFSLTVNKKRGGKDNRAMSLFLYQGVSFTRLIIEKLPLFALSGLSVLFSMTSLQHGGVVADSALSPMGLRLQNAITSYSAYMLKSLVPVNLTFFYPYPDAVALWAVLGSLGFVLLITVWAIRLSIRAPYVLIGWLWFLGTLVPVLGIVQVGLWPAIAERWAYVPLIGLYVIVAWGVPDCLRRLRSAKTFLPACAVILLVLFAGMTWKQIGYWKNDVTLFSHGVRVNPGNFVAHANLGKAYGEQGRVRDAIYHFEQAVAVNPNDVMVLKNLGRIHHEHGDADAAIRYYSQAAGYSPDDVQARYALGCVYAEQERTDEAIEEFLSILNLDDRHAGVHYSLGVLFAKKGEMNKAIEYLTAGLNIDPADAGSHSALGVIMMNKGRVDDAIGHFQEASRIQPDNPRIRNHLDAALEYREKRNANIAALEQKLQGNPNDFDSLSKLTLLYSTNNENTKALDSLFRMKEIKPDNPDVYYNIACIYAREHKIDQAVDWLGKSVEKGFRNWGFILIDQDLEDVRATDAFRDLMSRERIPAH